MKLYQSFPHLRESTVIDAELSSTPNGIRTRAAAVKGRCPRPLDDGGLVLSDDRLLYQQHRGPRDSRCRTGRHTPFAADHVPVDHHSDTC